jgi:hypothetical protein
MPGLVRRHPGESDISVLVTTSIIFTGIADWGFKDHHTMISYVDFLISAKSLRGSSAFFSRWLKYTILCSLAYLLKTSFGDAIQHILLVFLSASPKVRKESLKLAERGLQG